MTPLQSWTRLALMILWTAVASGQIVAAQVRSNAAQDDAREQDRVAFSHTLPGLDGAHLKATIVEVTYGPGGSSPPHSHPCPVIGYVLRGALRTQVKGEPERIYKAGESFYESPGGVHLMSANASGKAAVKFLAYFVCDHDTALSVAPPESPQPGGNRP
jgi:quercetin dioxygenase-like cupin family protein